MYGQVNGCSHMTRKKRWSFEEKDRHDQTHIKLHCGSTVLKGKSWKNYILIHTHRHVVYNSILIHTYTLIYTQKYTYDVYPYMYACSSRTRVLWLPTKSTIIIHNFVIQTKKSITKKYIHNYSFVKFASSSFNFLSQFIDPKNYLQQL